MYDRGNIYFRVDVVDALDKQLQHVISRLNKGGQTLKQMLMGPILKGELVLRHGCKYIKVTNNSVVVQEVMQWINSLPSKTQPVDLV